MSAERPALEAGPLHMDPTSYVATLDGEVMRLTTTEFNFLYLLVFSAPAARSRDDLYRYAFGDDLGQTRTIDIHMNRLRKKLGPHRDLIATVKRVGYQCTVRATRIRAAAETGPVGWDAPAETYTDCRSPEGVTVGLVDGLIAIARVLRSRPMETIAEREALEDLRSDEDVRWLLGLLPVGVEGGGAS